MRTDVKLGLVASVVCIGLGSWYFFDRPELGKSIPIEPDDALLADRGGGPQALPPETEWSQESRANRVGDPKALTGDGTERPDSPNVPPVSPRDVTHSVNEGSVQSKDSGLGELFTIGKSGDATGKEEQPGRQAFQRPIPAQPKPSSDADAPRKEKPEASTKPMQSEKPNPASPSTPGRVFVTHTVKSGDTLIGLSRMYFGDERFMVVIRTANPQVKDWGALTVDQKLRIPEDADLPASPSPADAKPKTRTIPKTLTIQSGDSLYSIATDVYGDGTVWEFIYARNRALIGDDPATLKVGTALKLPTLQELETLRKSKTAKPVP